MSSSKLLAREYEHFFHPHTKRTVCLTDNQVRVHKDIQRLVLHLGDVLDLMMEWKCQYPPQAAVDRYGIDLTSAQDVFAVFDAFGQEKRKRDTTPDAVEQDLKALASVWWTIAAITGAYYTTYDEAEPL